MINIDPEDYGYVREDSVPNVGRMYEMMQGMLEALYTTGDLEDLEHCLEEACSEINLSLPGKMLKVSTKGTDLKYHLGYQRGMIDSLNQRAL